MNIFRVKGEKKIVLKEVLFFYSNSSFECVESSPSSLSPWYRPQVSPLEHTQCPKRQYPLEHGIQIAPNAKDHQNHPKSKDKIAMVIL